MTELRVDPNPGTGAGAPERSLARSEAMWRRAQGSMVAGVPYHQLDRRPHPVYFERSEGAYIYDVDGNRYLDLQSGYSTMVLGHHAEGLEQALADQIARAPYLPAVHSRIVEWAEAICARIPGVDKVHFTDSASKATNLAVRIARAYTGRERFAKFGGGFHGSWDAVQYGTATRYGGDSTGMRPLPGISRSAAQDVVLLPYNELNECRRLIGLHAHELGSLIVEPVLGDGYIPPLPGFLNELESLCRSHGIVFICDETVTLTLAPGGAQELYGLTPELTTMGKAIGGGLPIGAVGGSDRIMALTDPRGEGLPVPSGGATLGGHILSAAAGLNQLSRMTPEVYDRLHSLGDRVRNGISSAAAGGAIGNLSATGVGHLLHLHWSAEDVVTHRDHAACDLDNLREIEAGLFADGFLCLPFGRMNLNAAMTETDADRLIVAISEHARRVAAG